MTNLYLIILVIFSILLAINLVVMNDKSKRMIKLFFTIVLLALIAFILLHIYNIEQESFSTNYYVILIISFITAYVLSFFIKESIYSKGVINTFQNELSKNYTEFSINKISKKEVVSENKIDVGAIRNCYDFKINVKKYNCDILVYRVQELIEEYHGDVDLNFCSYRYVTVDNIIEYCYYLSSSVDIVNLNTYVNQFRTNIANQNIEIVLNSDKLIIRKKRNVTKYNQDYIKEDIDNIKNFYEILMSGVI